MRLTQKFYMQATLDVAEALIGAVLVRQVGRKQLKALIVETEAYIGAGDTACHASKGKTQRTEVMFARAGHAYVYFIYGMHFMFNVVTEAEGHPSAVLIRAVQPLNYLDVLRKNRQVEKEKLLTNGPAKLCQAYEINKALNGWDLCCGQKLWLERPGEYTSYQVETSPRIGIDYAEEKDRLALWRFMLKNNPFVSK